MMLHNLAEWRDRAMDAEEQKLQKDPSYRKNMFKVIVAYDKENEGYRIHGSIAGVPGVWVSSQRNEVRIFKSLDTLAKALGSFGIRYFEVTK